MWLPLLREACEGEGKGVKICVAQGKEAEIGSLGSEEICKVEVNYKITGQIKEKKEKQTKKNMTNSGLAKCLEKKI